VERSKGDHHTGSDEDGEATTRTDATETIDNGGHAKRNGRKKEVETPEHRRSQERI